MDNASPRVDDILIILAGLPGTGKTTLAAALDGIPVDAPSD
jgi:predicted ATPase